jgi:hypothetical protein
MIEHSGSEAALVDGCSLLDNHSCMPLRPLDESFLPQLKRYRRANVQVVTLNVGFGEQTSGYDSVPAFAMPGAAAGDRSSIIETWVP